MSGTPTRPSREITPPSGGVSDANALVLAEPSHTGGTCPCPREAHDGTAAAGASLFLRVAFTRAGRDPPREWVDAAAGVGPDVRVVDATPCPSTDAADGVVAVAADGPGNLTDLGVRITDALAELDASGSAANGEPGPVCCLGSLTVLSQYVDTREAYRFLNAATSRVSSHGGVAHAHLHPEAHEQRTVDTLTSLFDVVAEPADDGRGLTVVRSRR